MWWVTILTTLSGGVIAAGTSVVVQRMMQNHAMQLERTKVRLDDERRLRLQRQEALLAFQQLGMEVEMMPIANLEYVHQLQTNPTTETCRFLLSRQADALQRFTMVAERLRVIMEPEHLTAVDTVTGPTINDCSELVGILFKIYGYVSIMENATRNYDKDDAHIEALFRDIQPVTQEIVDRVKALVDDLGESKAVSSRRRQEAADQIHNLCDTLESKTAEAAREWPLRWIAFRDQIAPFLRTPFAPEK